VDVIVAWKRVVMLEVTNQVFNMVTSNPFLSALECQDWARLYVTYQGLFGEKAFSFVASWSGSWRISYIWLGRGIEGETIVGPRYLT